MPAAILFDLDGTLFDRDRAVRALVRDQHARFRESLGGVELEAYVSRVLQLDAHGYRDKRELYGLVAGELGLPDTLAPRLTEDFWAMYHAQGRTFPDVMPALLELRRRGLLLGIVTNGAVRVQEPTIERLGLRELFDDVAISERERHRKPEPRIFARALERLGVAARDAWFVGDHPTTDVAGAHGAGLTALWRFAPHWPRPTVPCDVILGLDELPGLLDRSRPSGQR